MYNNWKKENHAVVVLIICVLAHRVSDPHWFNTDPDPGLWWPKRKKIYHWKKTKFCSKIAIYPKASIRTSKIHEKPSALKRRRTSKHEISSFFSIFVGHFCPPGSGSASGSENLPAQAYWEVGLRRGIKRLVIGCDSGMEWGGRI
jgi:hypothetical protein